MSPYILLTSTPYAFNSSELGGLASTSFAQLSAGQTFTGANIFQPSANSTGLVVQQSSTGSPTADIFDVTTANSSDVIQIAGPSANNANVTINPVGSGNTLALGTSDANETINLGAVGTTANTTAINVGTSTGAAQTIKIGGTSATSGSNSSTTVALQGGQTDFTVANAGATVQNYTDQ
jgi:hypothetical protein